MTDFIYQIRHADVFRGFYPKATQVFNNLSIDLKKHEHTAILGPNGSGKTTLLKLLTREISPVVKDGSFIKIFDQEQVNIWELRERIGVVSHDFQTNYQSLATGLDVVVSAFFGSIGIHQHQTPTEEQRSLAKQQLQKLNIEALENKPYLQLSTGQQRRLLLARALIHQPEVLIFDEPTNGLDIKSSIALLSELRKLARSGVTLILVTHHLDEIVPEIDRVVMLKQGEVMADGKKSSTLTEENFSQVFELDVTLTEEDGYYRVRAR